MNLKGVQIKLIIIIGFLVFFVSGAKSQIKVSCVGNSITAGFGLNVPYYDSYPSQLQVLLGSGWSINNYGVTGRTMLKQGTVSYWYENQYQQALNLNPNVVIIKLGTNDANLSLNWTKHKSEFIGDYKDMIKSFRDLGSKPKIWICLVVPVYTTESEVKDATIKNEVNPKIFSIALDEGVNLIDFYTAMSNSSYFQSDGIHPNITGAAKMASVVFDLFNMTTPQITKNENNVLSAPAAYDYQWYWNGSRIPEAEGGKGSTFKVIKGGYYNVSLKIASDNETRLVSDTVNMPIAYVKVVNNDVTYSVYPNPSSGKTAFIINNCIGQDVSLVVYYSSGIKVFQAAFPDNTAKRELDVDLSAFPSGVYTYKLLFKTHNIVGKLVIN